MGRLFLGSGGIILRRLWGDRVGMRERIEWDVFV